MTETLDARVIDFVTDVLGAMGLTVDVTLEETPDAVRVNITGDGAETLLRRQGETLDALQVIVNTAIRREERGERHYIVDAQGFRRDKDEELRTLARDLMRMAKESGVPQEMGPLNPYARRQVHLTVTEDPDMSSESLGDAFMKIVVIARKA